MDDDPAIVMLLELVLASVGYEVLLARDGMEAVALATDYPHAIDLLVTDIVMPGMNGC